MPLTVANFPGVPTYHHGPLKLLIALVAANVDEEEKNLAREIKATAAKIIMESSFMPDADKPYDLSAMIAIMESSFAPTPVNTPSADTGVSAGEGSLEVGDLPF